MERRVREGVLVAALDSRCGSADGAAVVDPLPQEEFSRLVRTAPIAVNTSGTFRGFSWWLAESFAAGCAIVCERQDRWLPFLVDGEHGVVVAEGVCDLVEAVIRLADDAERTTRQCEASIATYPWSLASQGDPAGACAYDRPYRGLVATRYMGPGGRGRRVLGAVGPGDIAMNGRPEVPGRRRRRPGRGA